MNLNLTILERVVTEAIDSVVAANKPEWLSSILKAQEVLITNPHVEMVDGILLLLSQTSNQIYTVNQQCNNEYGEPCKGFQFHRHCYHVALSRLVVRYLEACETKVVPLSQGKVALVDAADYSRIAKYKWTYLTKKRRGKSTQYARRSVWSKDKQQTVYLHRFILNAPAHLHVDHKNGDGLDNRRANLRLATNTQNRCNVTSEVSFSVAGFRGVQPCRQEGRFYARIRVNGQQVRLGIFDSAEAAARAYDAAAVKYHGEFATLNFPQALQVAPAAPANVREHEAAHALAVPARQTQMLQAQSEGEMSMILARKEREAAVLRKPEPKDRYVRDGWEL